MLQKENSACVLFWNCLNLFYTIFIHNKNCFFFPRYECVFKCLRIPYGIGQKKKKCIILFNIINNGIFCLYCSINITT